MTRGNKAVYRLSRLCFLLLTGIAVVGKACPAGGGHFGPAANPLALAVQENWVLIVVSECTLITCVLFAPRHRWTIAMSSLYGMLIVIVQLALLGLPETSSCGCLGSLASTRATESLAASFLLISILGYTIGAATRNHRDAAPGSQRMMEF